MSKAGVWPFTHVAHSQGLLLSQRLPGVPGGGADVRTRGPKATPSNKSRLTERERPQKNREKLTTNPGLLAPFLGLLACPCLTGTRTLWLTGDTTLMLHEWWLTLPILTCQPLSSCWATDCQFYRRQPRASGKNFLPRFTTKNSQWQALKSKARWRAP